MHHRTFRQRKCAICDSTLHTPIYSQRFEAMPGGLLEGYEVVACQNCGFCFADDIPDQDAFDVYYREMSKYEYGAHMGQVSQDDVARFQQIAGVVTPFLVNQKVNVLEIGCATGGLLWLLKNAGFPNVVGVDPSPGCAEAARRLYDIPVLANSLSDVEVPASSVDVLILVGVVEHVRELNLALMRCRDMLSPDGLIYVVVPDGSRYVNGTDAPFQEFSVEHINFFGPISLKNLLQKNGFEPVSIKQDLMRVNAATITPALYGIFRKSVELNPANLANDKETAAGVRAYVELCAQQDDKIRQAIDAIVARGEPIIVWGAGAHTRRLLAMSQLSKARIRAFVDSNPKYQGKELSDSPVVAPDEIREFPYPILISSRAYQDEIETQIRDQLQIKNRTIRLYD